MESETINIRLIDAQSPNLRTVFKFFLNDPSYVRFIWAAQAGPILIGELFNVKTIENSLVNDS